MMAYGGCVFVHEDFVSAYRWAKMQKLVGGFKHLLFFASTCKDDSIWMSIFSTWVALIVQKNYEISFGQNIATSNDLAPNGSGSVKEIPLFKDMKIHLGEILQLGQIS